MLGKAIYSSLLTAAMTAVLASRLWAAAPVHTTIQVHNMHCASCAKKIASKLYAVPGVIGVKTSVAANTAWVTPQRQRQPSPRALWEAVEKAGFKPARIDGPAGAFTAKPAL